MSENLVKLNAYFGERLRSGHQFAVDALLQHCAELSVADSLVLRGIASFGPGHHLRSDQTLSMSEDPPIAVVAVDSSDTIAELSEHVAAIAPGALVTIENQRGAADPATQEDFARLVAFVGRSQRVADQLAYRTVCERLYEHGFASATVLLGVDGTVQGEHRRARFFGLNVGVPAMIIGAGTGQQVNAAVADLQSLLSHPVVSIGRTQLCKYDGRLLSRPSNDAHTRWQQLTIQTSEAMLHLGEPMHRAIVRRLRESRTASGATVLRGVWGFQADGKPHGDRLIQLGRRVPITTVVVDTPDRIAASFNVVDELTDTHGVITCQDVSVPWLPQG